MERSKSGPAITLFGLCFITLLCSPRALAAQEEVSFRSGPLTLRGYLYRPEGDGPFPAVLFNHGSQSNPGKVRRFAERFRSRGFVFFVPHRRGHGMSADQAPYIGDLLVAERETKGWSSWGQLLTELMTTGHLEDQLSALQYLQTLPIVDQTRIAVVGCSFGGIQTVLSAAKASGVKAGVAFGTAAQTWSLAPALQAALLEAARGSHIPLLFVQAANDYDLSPSYHLAAAMEQQKLSSRVMIYPRFGDTERDGHSFCGRGGSIWEEDVLSFLNEHLAGISR